MKQVPMHLRNPRRQKERGNDMTTHTRPRQTCAAWIAAFGMALVAANATAQSNTVPGRIIEINVPGSGARAGQGTQAIGVNERGAIVGFYIDATYAGRGFLRNPDGRFAKFDPVGSTYTYVYGLNREGAVTGFYSDANSVFHGFQRTPDGEITTFDAPDAGTGAGQGTITGDINDSGVIAGYYYDAIGVAHGFVRAPDGKITSFDAPGAGTGVPSQGIGQGTFPQFFSSLTPAGAITGFYVDANYLYHGFVRKPDGSFTSFEAPGAGTTFGLGTISYSINPEGETTGPYYDANSVAHGFLHAPNGWMTTFDVSGAGTGAGQGTYPMGNNSPGAIQGYYVDASDVAHGFLRDTNGKITTFNVSTSATGAGTGAGQGTYPMTNNSEGTIAGFYLDAKNAYHGFLRAATPER